MAKILTTGFTSEKLDLTADLIKITTGGIGFLVLSAWCLGVLNSHRKFFLSYVAPVIWNAAQIVILFIAINKDWDPTKAAKAAAWGLLLGGIAQLLFQFPGDDVTECLGGGVQLEADDLSKRYETMCDPRLNGSQSIDIAFRIAVRLYFHQRDHEQYLQLFLPNDELPLL